MIRFAVVCLAAALVAGCGSAPRETTATGPAKPGSYVEEAGFASPFYAEELYNGRLYVFGHKNKWQKFMDTKDADPKFSKTLIGKGPLVDDGSRHMTLVMETTTDEPAMDQRIINRVKERYNLAF